MSSYNEDVDFVECALFSFPYCFVRSRFCFTLANTHFSLATSCECVLKLFIDHENKTTLDILLRDLSRSHFLFFPNCSLAHPWAISRLTVVCAMDRNFHIIRMVRMLLDVECNEDSSPSPTHILVQNSTSLAKDLRQFCANFLLTIDWWTDLAKPMYFLCNRKSHWIFYIRC